MNIELNKKLLEASIKENIVLDEIVSLLKQGADPLGPIYEDDNDDNVLSELVMDFNDIVFSDKKGIRHNAVDLIELFINNGLDVSRIDNPHDEWNGGILWQFSFICSETAIQILKLFIEHGITCIPLENFIEHFYGDICMVDGELFRKEDKDIPTDYYEYLEYGFKMIMLCAAYPHILNNSEYIRRNIELDTTNKENNYDLTKFKDYNNYKYEISTEWSLNYEPYGFHYGIVKIIEKSSNDVVWEMHI